MSLKRLAKVRARRCFPSPKERPEHFAYTLGFMAGYRLAIERILWAGVLVAAFICSCAWLFKI